MIPIFICEDNPTHKKKITKCVKDYVLIENLNMQVVLASDNPHKILNHVENDPKLGIYFLDVDLNTDINGIQLADRIRKHDPRGFIVFITTLAEALHFTFKYKVEALDYIVKDDIKNVGTRIGECLDNIKAKCASNPDTVKRFSFKVLDNKLISLDYDSILYFETSTAAPRKVVLYSLEGRYEFYANMKDLHKTLDERFFRCHHSFIVNIKNIKNIDFNNKEAEMTDGSKCLVSVRQVGKLKEVLLAHGKA